MLEAKQHTFTIQLPQESLWLQADALRLAQVVGNLLTNAAKFTPARGRVELHAARVADDVVIHVVDNGIGLALAKGLVEMHGGTIAARSAGSAQGTELIVTLPPVSAAPAAPAARPTAAPVLPPSSGVAVLVADDNRDAAQSLAILLRLAGHEVTAVHDGLAAWELIERARPAIALLDIGMPQLNGYEIAARVRAAPWGREITLIALTGWGQASDRKRALTAGFDEHWVKPIAPEVATELCAITARRLARGREDQAPA